MASSKVVAAENLPGDRSQKPGLLDLPPEIWSKICKLAVEQQATIRAFRVRRKRHDPKTPEEAVRALNCREWEFIVRQPALLFTSRAIREECLAHYYKANKFHGDSWFLREEDLKKWLNAIGKTGRNAVAGIYYRTSSKNANFATITNWEEGNEHFESRKCSEEETKVLKPPVCLR